MMTTLKLDFERRPGAFLWNGRIQPALLEEWKTGQAWRVPHELLTLWQETGGGEMFEGEVLLAPLGSDNPEESYESTNAFYSARGKPTHIHLFHVGASHASAWDEKREEYVVVSLQTFDPKESYTTLEEWYSGHLRRQYAERYKLP